MISVEGLTVEFGGFTLFDDVSFVVWLQRYNLSIKKASTLCRGFFIKDPVPSLSCFSSNVHAAAIKEKKYDFC